MMWTNKRDWLQLWGVTEEQQRRDQIQTRVSWKLVIMEKDVRMSGCESHVESPNPAKVSRDRKTSCLRVCLRACLCVQTNSWEKVLEQTHVWQATSCFGYRLPSHAHMYTWSQKGLSTWRSACVHGFWNLLTTFLITQHEKKACAAFQENSNIKGNSNKTSGFQLMQHQTTVCQEWHNCKYFSHLPNLDDNFNFNFTSKACRPVHSECSTIKQKV